MGLDFEECLSKCGLLISYLSQICIDDVKFDHNYLTITRVVYNVYTIISNLRKQ
jgi:hypothetical protein